MRIVALSSNDSRGKSKDFFLQIFLHFAFLYIFLKTFVSYFRSSQKRVEGFRMMTSGELVWRIKKILEPQKSFQLNWIGKCCWNNSAYFLVFTWHLAEFLRDLPHPHKFFFFLILSFNILQFLFPWNFFYSNGSVAKQCWCCCDFRRFLHDPFYILITAVNKIWIFFIHHHLFLLVVATVQRWFNPHLLKPKGFSLSLSKGSEKMSESFSVQREKTGNILFFLFQLLTAGGWSRGYLGAF